MMKTGAATAMLAMATLSGSASAQNAPVATVTPSGPESEPVCAALWAHCRGPEAGDNATCCDDLTSDFGVQCVRKNEQYAQCRPAGEVSPLGWMGEVLVGATGFEVATTETITDTVDAAAAEVGTEADPAETGVDADAEVKVDGEGPVVMDAEDMVELGLAPPGMDAEDLIEMDMVPGMEVDSEAEEEQLVEDAQEIVVAEDAEMNELVDVPDATEVLEEVPEEDEEVIAEDEEVELMPYMAFIGQDYTPVQESALVTVENIEGGKENVASPEECEDFCDITPGCNAASYYLNPVAGFNCWLKTLGNSCALPMYSFEDDNAVLLLQINESCDIAADAPAGTFADGPLSDMMDALAPNGMEDLDYVAIDADEDAVPPAATVSTDRDLDTETAVPVTTPLDTDGTIVSVRGALIAMAVAGGAALI